MKGARAERLDRAAVIAAPFCLLLISGLTACAIGVPQRVDGPEGLPVEPRPALIERDFANMTPDEIHAAVFEDEKEFPSALSCARCHPQHFDEWAASPHAYAQMSPVFNAMHGTIVKRTNGTNGDFCIRCHTPVGMQKNEPVFTSNLDRHPASREGITCIVCHRVNQNYGKVSARFGVVRGDLDAPVFGPDGGERLAQFTAENKVRQRIHSDAQQFFELTKPGFCGTCHDVNLPNGFRLEEAFSFFKTSPAAAEGTTCQDCHMGTEPGVPSGYAHGPAAIVNKKATQPRKLTNHTMSGPDHSVLHPGLFPHNLKMARSKRFTLRDWLSFDYEAGWGTTAFEDLETLRRDAQDVREDEELDAEERAEELAFLEEEFGGKIPAPTRFPATWQDTDKRRQAATLLRENLQKLWRYSLRRKQVLQAGFQIEKVELLESSPEGLKLRVRVINPTNGHNTPTGFIAERVLFLRVFVRDATGKVIFKSGDYDPNGDVRDSHSVYVHNGELPLDRQLFSLQSRFLTRNLRGGEREQVLAVNYSPDPLPFVRPARRSATLDGRPAGARIHRQTLPPLGGRWASYTVDGKLLTGKAPYTVEIALICGMVPSNLIAEIAEVGFDYQMSPRLVAERVLHGVPWGPYRPDAAQGATLARELEPDAFAAYLDERRRGVRRKGIGGHVTLAERRVVIDVR